MTSVKVAVRARPLNQRENELCSQVIVEMEGDLTRITNPKISESNSEGDTAREQLKVREFTFDHSFWSLRETDANFVTQKQVFDALGPEVVSSAFDGYNVCIFAYGQTGSGKTYTMMGTKEDPGLIPRYCNALFDRLTDDSATFQIHVSYLEIYNEKVRDLLKPQSSSGKVTHNLRVREHPRDGPYVQDLSKHSVINYEGISTLMMKGNSLRTTASTNMNDTSSRSHAIFTISFTQARFMDGMPSERLSKINLVDLAGSERADATGATGLRLKEGGSINKSLVSLGNVISLLAERSESQGKSRGAFIPYRDSVLTWLLKDSLGGNAKTIMIATLSPADVNYGETLSTLRYANRAKNIINRPTVNEDPNVKLIRELREEIARLKSLLAGSPTTSESPRVQERLHESEARMKVLTEEWTEKWKESANLLQEKNLALRKDGVGVVLDSALPHLIGIDEDMLSTGIKLFHLKEGITKIGSEESDENMDITLSGADIETEHCVIEHIDGCVVLHPIEAAKCFVNGQSTSEPVKLTQGMLIQLGKTNMFRFNHPDEARKLKKNMALRKSTSVQSLDNGKCGQGGSTQDIPGKLALLSQSMTELYRSTDSLALHGSMMDISSVCREDQEELEQMRTNIMELEDSYIEKEEMRREEERLIEEEISLKNEKLQELDSQIEELRNKNNPYDNVVDGLRQLDKKEEELLDDLKVSKDNLLKEIENLTWFQDHIVEKESVQQIISDLDRQITEKDEQIGSLQETADQKKVTLETEKKEVREEIEKLEGKLLSLEDKYDIERTNLVSGDSQLLHEVQDLTLREEELIQQHEQITERKRNQWKSTLETLNQHTATIEEAWKDLADNQARVKVMLDKGAFSSYEEKLECQQEAEQLAEAHKLLQEEETSFAEHQKEEMARVEAEMEVWEKQRVSEMAALQMSRQSLLYEKSPLLQAIQDQMDAKKRKLEQLKTSYNQVETRLGENSEDLEQQIKGLESDKETLLKDRTEMERKMEENNRKRKEKIEELEGEMESLEFSCDSDLETIRQERLRLVNLQEEVLRKSTVDSDTNRQINAATSEDLRVQKQELEQEQKKLEIERHELEMATADLLSKQKQFADEREAQLDKIEFEKLKLLDLERQDRVNSLVQQEVKCRLFEEKLEREKLRKLERDREKQEREKEIQRLKSMHQREMNQLRAQLERKEMPSTSGGWGLRRSQSCYSQTIIEEQKNKLLHQLTFNDPPDMVNLEIPTFVLRGSGKDLHYEYLVKVSIGAESWSIFRRYSRFRDMHNNLRKKYPPINQLVFPPRKFFHRREKVAAERRSLLEEYIRHVIELCMRIPDCPLNKDRNRHLTKQVLIEFDPFFRKGFFESGHSFTS